MRTGYCRHDWTEPSTLLSDAFPTHAGEVREFRVCARCLRIEELEPVAVAIDFPSPGSEERPAAAESDDRAA